MKKHMKFGRPYRSYISKDSKKQFRKTGIWILILLSAIYCVVFTLIHIYPVIEDVSKSLLNAYGTEIINRAILEDIEGSDIYNEIITTAKDENNNISYIQTNSANMNKLKSRLSLNVLNKLDQFGSKGFTIPLGNLTDIILLSGIGPVIPFKIIPYGSADINFRSEFSSAGINQTRHEIYIDVTAKLHAISAVSQIETVVTTSVMACQTVIVGDVPQFFAGVTN